MKDNKGESVVRKSVLVVEDEPLITFMIMEILAGAGYEVAGTVASGEEAVKKIGLQPSPGLVLMDIGLIGKLNGIETAKAIRERSRVPIVFFAAYESENIIADIPDIPRSCYIPKPFENTSIIEAVDKMGKSG
jgi:DNA-binding NarL/FixJ family response regulator